MVSSFSPGAAAGGDGGRRTSGACAAQPLARSAIAPIAVAASARRHRGALRRSARPASCSSPTAPVFIMSSGRRGRVLMLY